MPIEVYDGEVRLIEVETGEARITNVDDTIATMSESDSGIALKLFSQGDCVAALLNDPPRIELSDPRAGLRIEFLIDKEGGASYTSTSESESSELQFVLRPNGSMKITAVWDGKSGVELNVVRKLPAMALLDAEGRVRARCLGMPDNSASFQLLDERGQITFSWPEETRPAFDAQEKETDGSGSEGVGQGHSAQRGPRAAQHPKRNLT